MDEPQRKKALRMVPYGLYLMGVRRKEVRNVATDLNVFLSSWVTQVSFKPPMLVVGVKRDAHSNAMLKESGVFSLNILGAEQKELATTFMKALTVTPTQMSGVPYFAGKETGCPIIPQTPAHVECVVEHVYDGDNDHSVVIGRIVDVEHRRDAKPLTHAETGWHYAG